MQFCVRAIGVGLLLAMACATLRAAEPLLPVPPSLDDMPPLDGAPYSPTGEELDEAALPPSDAYQSATLDPWQQDPAPTGWEALCPPQVAAPTLIPRDTTESWLHRPYSIGWFTGGYFMADPIPQNVEGGNGYFTGFTLGWDTAPHWGLESRFGFGYPGIEDPAGQVEYSSNHVYLWDCNLMLYPWAEGRFHPYFSLGTGLTFYDYYGMNVRVRQTFLTMPLGLGFKYRYGDRIAFRFELKDEFTFSSGLQQDLHNLSVTAGIETRFGGGRWRASYWPWNPDSSNW